jgi:predicted NACHT family NTPase
MVSGIAKIIGTEILKLIVSNGLKKIKPEMFHYEKDEMEKFKDNFKKQYGNHFREICSWANSIPFIGLAKPKETDSSTVELIIASDIIRYERGDEHKVNELEILNSQHHILLIGAPGAGKTTTLKRIILKYFNEFSSMDNPGYPVLVRLRDIPAESTLFKYILDIFAITYIDKEIKVEKTRKKKDEKTKEIYYEEYVEEKLITYVGTTPIQNFMAVFLNESNCMLILDGIDELHKSIQLSTFREIEQLGLKLDRAKILMTVRKSELNKVIDSFTIFEIAALSSKQIREIAGKWLKNSDQFIIELEKKPYRDLANRPIFLTFLLILFERYSTIPMQPSEVYEDTTYLILKEWDEHRDIVRTSRYGDFNTRKKLKFIAELSYCLTYKIKQKVFSSKDLEKIYIQINSKYGLPDDDVKTVVSEIESHTGLIVESTYKNFEFSHLSMQEFLCAKHIVNLPYSKETIAYFLEYPEPLAIAVCISGEPSIWFANLILNSSLNITNFKSNEKPYLRSVYSILTRLLVETPSFSKSEELGLAFIYLISNLHPNKNFELLLDEWFEYPEVKESLALGLKKCKFSTTRRGYHLITKTNPTNTNYFITIPNSGEIPDNYIKKMREANLILLARTGIIE